jgi:CRP-like cAMP-binding protein
VDRLDRLAAQSVTSRLATWLLARRRETGAQEFSLGRTQSEAAEELGTVREVLVRSLRDLRTAGLIRWVGRGRYEIIDETGLKQRAAETTSDGPTRRRGA